VARQFTDRFRFVMGTAVVVSLAVVGSVSVAVGIIGSHHALAPPVSGSMLSSIEPSSSLVNYKVNPSLRASTPLFLRIPAIGVRTKLITLGLKSDGSIQVPTNSAQAGWFKLGPTPGQRGSSVILGHVDSFRGPAIFYRLRSLVPGNRLIITLKNHLVATFRVKKVAMYSKRHFPAKLVYGDRHYAALQLVTCGGAFDSASGSYLSNVVVYSRLVSISRRP
jgi:hypothetical protein